MRRTDTIRLFIIDRSVLARNMYQLLFADLPGYRVEYGENGKGLAGRQRRARPHLVIVNGNAFQESEQDDRTFLEEYSTILLVSPTRSDLKEFAQQKDNITVVQKPFYPYDLITVINRIAGASQIIRRSKKTAEGKKAHA